MDSREQSGPVRARYKVGAYVLAWIAALFATDPSLGMFTLAWMFPLGLAATIDRHSANAGGWGIFSACVAAYLVHAYFYFRSKRRKPTVILYCVLIILLLGNVSGCREMVYSHH